MTYEFVIGIDPGVNTGIAIRHYLKIYEVRTTDILTAIDLVKSYSSKAKTLVFIEDPNKRKWFGGTGRERLQGAGSIKRDYSIWIEFLSRYEIPFVAIAPADVPKIDKEIIKVYWEGQTSKHSRDAIILAMKNEKLYEATLLRESGKG